MKDEMLKTFDILLHVFISINVQPFFKFLTFLSNYNFNL